jgi:hypothetical protein
VCGPERLDVLVTDEDADPGTLDVVRQAGAEVVLA